MACYYPTPALHDPASGATTLWPPVGDANTELPCGTCIGCKTDRALDWARRAQHEASCWPHNSFLTLTYRDEELPSDGLVPQHLQAFIKRLRQRHYRADRGLLRVAGQLRYLACGEYGDQTQRPHYHLCLFNCGFADTYRVAADLYESPLLNELWPYGNHRLGELTPASANYVAQYTLKKIGATMCDADGVVIPSPFLRASTKPAIGAFWLSKFYRDVTHGYLVYDGTPGRVPRTYIRWLEKHQPQLAEQSRFAAQLRQAKQHRPAAPVGCDPLRASASGSTSNSGLSTRSKTATRNSTARAAQAATDETRRRREAADLIHRSRNSLHHERTL